MKSLADEKTSRKPVQQTLVSTLGPPLPPPPPTEYPVTSAPTSTVLKADYFAIRSPPPRKGGHTDHTPQMIFIVVGWKAKLLKP